MPDANSNVDLAHDLSKHGHHGGSAASRHTWLGFIEAIVLAIVAVATAWSGYQASRWEGASTTDYALYERYTVLSQAKATLAGQDRLYDIVTFNGWVAAKVGNRERIAAFYERRFRPEYALAFKAWWRLDPIRNAKAPPGPIFMPQYKSANTSAADHLASFAEKYFDGGVTLRKRADDYVRTTVLLATVLFLTALSQRFDAAGPRAIIIAIAGILLSISLFGLATLPRT